MKKQLIELEKLDELLIDFKQMKNKGESFSDFIKVSKCLFDNEPALFDWVYVNKSNIEEVKECINCGNWITSPNAKRCKICSNHLKRNKPLSKKHRENVIKANKRRTGTKHTKKTKKYMSLAKSNIFHPNWKGGEVGNQGLHQWIRRHKAKPDYCEDCKKVEPKEVANISGKYKRDVNDYKWLCRKCHHKMDNISKKIWLKRRSIEN